MEKDGYSFVAFWEGKDLVIHGKVPAPPESTPWLRRIDSWWNTCSVRYFLRYHSKTEQKRGEWKTQLFVHREKGLVPYFAQNIEITLPKRRIYTLKPRALEQDPEPPHPAESQPNPIYTFTASRRKAADDPRVTIRGNVYGPHGTKPHLELRWQERKRTRRYRLHFIGERGAYSPRWEQLKLFFWADIPRYVDRIEIELPGGSYFTIHAKPAAGTNNVDKP